MKPSLIAIASLTLMWLATSCPGAPIIARQPSPLSNSVSVGASLTNSISAITTNPPLGYLWKLNGVALANATNAVLILNDIQLLKPASMLP
jgi:hypothetical protein